MRLSKYLAPLAIIGSLVLPLAPSFAAGGLIPEAKTDAAAMPVNAASFTSLLLIDPASGKVLYQSKADRIWAPASLTKLMTCVVFDSTPTNWSAKAAILKQDEVGGGRLQVPSGSVMTLKDLLFSAIVGSANNAAMALGRLFDGKGMAAFLARMNTTAVTYGLAQSHFFDAAGMNPKNTTSAYDIASLMMISEQTVDMMKQAMMTAHYKFTVMKPVMNKDIKNTNDMLLNDTDAVVTGGKTGFIYESMYNLAVRAYPKGEPGKELLVVVLGAETRDASFDAARKLLHWGWDDFTWKASTSTVHLALNHQQGDKGDDIKTLQQYLNTHGFPIAASGAGSKSHETTLFGPLTVSALKRFQEAHAKEILTPHGAKMGSGYLDVFTRAYINGATE
jgi:serine-type D-Ala-D-Ala endopeptidase (penicillin-binding protein 7)